MFNLFMSVVAIFGILFIVVLGFAGILATILLCLNICNDIKDSFYKFVEKRKNII